MENKLRYDFRVRVTHVLNSTYQTYITELNRFFNFIDKNPLLSGILEEIRVDLPDFDTWYKSGDRKKGIYLPDDVLDAVKLYLVIIERILKEENNKILIDLVLFTGCFDNNMTSTVRHFLEVFFTPITEYIESKIEGFGSLIYLLDKYKRMAEWFEQEKLFEIYNSKGEAGLDKEVRKFLFDNGVEYPFSEPSSPSGKADIVSNINSEDPLVLEIKIYDSGKYRKEYIKKGFTQVYRYANDYNKPIGYLVVFNVSKDLINFKLENQVIGPTKILFNGKTIFIIIIDINPEMPSASSNKKLKITEITEKFLTSNI